MDRSKIFIDSLTDIIWYKGYKVGLVNHKDKEIYWQYSEAVYLTKGYKSIELCRGDFESLLESRDWIKYRFANGEWNKEHYFYDPDEQLDNDGEAVYSRFKCIRCGRKTIKGHCRCGDDLLD